MNFENVTPTFVIEYNYQFEKLPLYSSNLTNDAKVQFDFATTNISLIDNNFQLKKDLDTRNLTSLNLSNQNLLKVELNYDLPNLKELNLSFNNLRQFPDADFLKDLQVLNLSFNKIAFFNIRGLFQLEQLDISWNNLIEYMPCIKIFEKFIPKLKDVNTKFNPFNDIIDPTTRAILSQTYLSGLKVFDGLKIEENTLKEFESSRKCCNGSMNVFDNIIKPSISFYKINQGLKTLKLNENSSKVKRMNISGNLIKDMNFTGDFPALQELCVSNNILTEISIKTLKYLMKLNLSSNFIKNVKGLRKDNLPALKYLDLSNNLIASILSMGNHENLTEFYCYQNKITELSEILNLRNWSRLRVVNLLNNGETDSLWRTFLLFHLPNIKV